MKNGLRNWGRWIGLTAIFCIGFAGRTGAVGAYPYPVQVQQPDGSVLTVRLYGDEFFHYATTESGYIVAQKEDGFYYYADFDASGALVVSDTRAGTGMGGGMRTRSSRAGVLQQLAVQARERMARTVSLLPNTAGFPRTGSPKSLVILASFADNDFVTPNPQQAFSRLLNEPGYADNGGTGSAKDYYRDNSGGVFTPEFVVVGPVKLDREMSFYGGNTASGNDSDPQQMVIDACRKAQQEGVNFSDYDTDGDGYVDNVFIYYAGYNEAEGASKETVWPHRWTVNGNSTPTLNGVKLLDYACTSELKGSGPTSGTVMAGIGTFCHEFGHVLGFADLYDTGNAGGPGLYNFSLMCSGNYNNEGRTPPCLNGVERAMAGWMELKEIDRAGSYSLTPIHQNQDAYVLGTEMKGEFFLLENRQSSSVWDRYLPHHGMLVYHVDQSTNMVGGATARSRWNSNTVNNIAAHQCMDLVEASGREIPAGQVSVTELQKMFFPGTSNVTAFGAGTVPGAVAWSGANAGKNLVDIRENGESVEFEVELISEISVVGKTVNTLGTPVEGATVAFTAMEEPAAVAGEGGELQMLKTMRASSSAVSVTTNASGGFTVTAGLDAGKYEVRVSKEGYADYVQVMDLHEGGNAVNGDGILVLKTPEEAKSTRMKWYEGEEYDALVGTGKKEAFVAGVLWAAEDLRDYVGCLLKEVRIRLVAQATTELYVYFDDEEMLRKPLTELYLSEFSALDLEAENLLIPAGKAVRIGFRISDYANYAAAIDAGPAADGKGNLLSVDGGATWNTLKESNMDGNWLIDMTLYKADINVDAGQRDVWLTWRKADYPEGTTWEVQWKKKTDAAYGERVGVDTVAYRIGGLEPDTEYEVKLTVAGDPDPTKEKMKEFRTGALTSDFPAIDRMGGNFRAGDKLLLRIRNVPEAIGSLVWKWDGETVTGDEVTLTGGTHELRAEVTTAGGGTEVILRRITVQE